MPPITHSGPANRSGSIKGLRLPGQIGLLSLLTGLAMFGWLLTGSLTVQATAPTAVSQVYNQDNRFTFPTTATSNTTTASITPTNQPYTWGYGAWGRLGNGSTLNSNTPVLVGLLAGGFHPLQMSAGVDHSLAINSDGKLYAWGSNSYGQLGNGSTNFSGIPTAVSLPAGVSPVQAAAGQSHSLAIGSDGNLYAWGYNRLGQLGNSSTVSRSLTPVVVSLPAGVSATQVGAGVFHSLAIGNDNNLYAWGDNEYGQLGNSSTISRSLTPVMVNLPAGVSPIQVAAGYDYNLAIGSDGNLYAWGSGYGSTPVVVSLPAGVRPSQVAAGESHSLVIGSDGNLYAWGWNEQGQVGIGNIIFSIKTPTVVSLPAGVSPIQAAGGEYHSLAIGSDGKLYAWGAQQLGNSSIGSSTTPVVVSLPVGTTPIQMVGGDAHSLAIGADGNLYTWGDNTYGQLGNGSTDGSDTPLVISLTTGVTPTQVAAGYDFSLAIGSDGKLYAWGYNNYGELGTGTRSIGTIAPNPTPLVVKLPAGVTPTRIAGGRNHAMALGSDGKLYAWGNNLYGQLGNGANSTYNPTPLTVSLPPGVVFTAIAAGQFHSLAIGSDGKLYAWGANYYGQLGDGSTTNRNTPTVVKLPAGVSPVQVAAGFDHSLAIGSDGKLYAWGYNSDGQLGNGASSDQNPNPTPLTVSLSPGVVPTAIAAGQFHSLAIGSDGQLYAWGNNDVGQLGNGTTISSYIPLTVNLPAGVTPIQVASGILHSLALVTPLPPQITVSRGNLQSASVGTAFGAPVVAVVRDGATNNPVAGVNVLFTVTGVGASGTFAGGSTLYIGTTDASGMVTATSFTANTIPGSYSITATVSGGTAPANFTLTNLAGPAASVMAVSGGNQSATVNTAFTSPLVVSVTDQYNNPVSGTLVSFAAPASGASASFAGGVTTATTGPNGQATSPALSANSVAGSYSVTATVSGVATPATFSLTNQPGAASNLSIVSGDGQGTQVTNTFPDPLAVHVTDSSGNAVSGVSIVFAAPSSGASGSFAQAGISVTVTTNANGDATAPAFTANTVAGDYSVSAAIVPNTIARAHGLAAGSLSFTLTNLSGPANTVAVVSGNNQSATVNTAFSAPLVVSVTDQYANPISGTTVTFAVPASGASAAFAGGVNTALTGSNGQATSPALTANSVAGSYSVTASVQGENSIVSTNFSLTNQPGAASGIAIVGGDNQQTVISTAFASPLVAKVTDSSGNAVSGVGVVFTAPVSGANAAFGGSSVYTGTTDAAGLVTSTIPAANSTAGSYTVSAVIVPSTYPARALPGGVGPRVTSVQYHLTNLVGAPATISVVSGGGQSAVVSTTFGNPLVAKVVDSGNNPVSSIIVTFTAPSSGASGDFAGNNAVYTGTTDGSGVVTSTAFTANLVTGVYTVTATVGGVSNPANFQLTNLAECNPLIVTSSLDDGSCGTLRQAVVFASTNPTKTVMINLSAGSVISLTTGLTLTSGVSITTTASCGVGPNNTMLPPITIKSMGVSSGNGLTLVGSNRLYGLWVRGFSGLQIHALAGSHAKMQCVRASKN